MFYYGEEFIKADMTNIETCLQLTVSSFSKGCHIKNSHM